MVVSQKNLNPRIRTKFGALLLQSEPNLVPTTTHQDDTGRDYSDYYPQSTTASAPMSPTIYTTSSPSNGEASPYGMSPWNNPSPYTKSPWIIPSPMIDSTAEIDYKKWKTNNQNGLIGSLVRKEGHIYSLAVAGDLLYTGSDSRNIRVWKSLKEFTGFKSNSGLVKAIVVNDWRIFTGHQDGKIRVWKVSSTNPKNHRRIGNLPTFKDFVKSSMNPRNYVEVRRHRNVVRIRHYDAVSCMSLNEEQGVLYSASWDKTVKVWRLADLKCLESITAHDDAVNAVVSAFGNLVFTGSADGTMKMWRREVLGKTTKHLLVQVLLEQESAVTALAVSRPSDMIYCGSSDGVVNYWVKEKQYLCHGGMLKGHKLAILCLATAGHGLLLSGSADRTICVWRREVEDGSHTCLSFLTGHTGPVKCLAVEEDLSDDHDEDRDQDRRWIVYSGSLDKSVKVWRVKE